MQIKKIQVGHWYQTVNGIGRALRVGGTYPPSIRMEIIRPIPRGIVNVRPRDVQYEVQQLAVVPTVHLNGTSQEALVEQYRHAVQKVDEALEALRAAAPHGRDYYQQGEGSFKAAVTQFLGWERALVAVRDQVSDILEYVEGLG